MATNKDFKVKNGILAGGDIVTSANIGAGTTTPGARLEAKVAAVTSANAIFSNTVNAQTLTIANAFNYTTDGSGSAVVASSSLLLRANGNNVLIDASGNLLIGATSQTGAAKLYVAGARSFVSGEFLGGLHVTDSTTGGAAGVGGTLAFGADSQGAGIKQYGAIAGTKENSTATDLAGYLAFYSRPAGGSLTERMRIDSAGNVGIGAGPSFKFDVQNTANSATVARVYNGTTGSSGSTVVVCQTDAATTNLFANSSGNLAGGVSALSGIQVTTNTPFGIWTNNAERIRITASGDVGIGTPSPTSKLHVAATNAIISAVGTTGWSGFAGSTSSGSATLAVDDAVTFGGAAGDAVLAFASAKSLFFRGGTNERMRIDSAGNLGIGTTAPGYKLDVSSTSQNNPVVRIIKANSGTANEHGGALIIANQGPANQSRAGGTYGGRIVFQYSQPTSQAMQDGASIYSAADSTQFGTATAAFLGFCTSDATGGGANAERMRIDSAGNVGVGTGTPTAKLHVSGGLGVMAASSAYPGPTQQISVRLSADSVGNSTDVPGIDLRRWDGSATQHWVTRIGMDATNSGSLVFMMDSKTTNTVATTERMRINSAGNLLIGGTTNVQGIITAKGTIACIDNSESFLGQFAASSGVTSISGYSATGQALALMTTPSGSGAVERVRIKATGEVGIGTNNPTYPLDVVGTLRVTSSALIGGSMLGLSTISSFYTPTTYYKIATLPASTAGTFDQMTVIANFNDNWNSGSNRCGTFVFANRGSFTGKFLRLEGGVPTVAARVLAYTESDGTVSIYLSTTTGYYSTIAAEVLTSSQVTLYPTSAGVTSVTGTLSFDSSTAVPVICTDTAANVMIGKTASSANGDGAQIFPTGTIGLGHVTGTVTGTAYAAFGYANSGIGSITQNGTTAVAYNTTSDARLKKNIVAAPSAAEKVKAMQVRSFDWKADDSHVEHGFIAQELQIVEPLAVTEGETWQIDPSKLVATLTKALQEALSEIDSLKARVAALEI
jgi:hypothetical protein